MMHRKKNKTSDKTEYAKETIDFGSMLALLWGTRVMATLQFMSGYNSFRDPVPHTALKNTRCNPLLLSVPFFFPHSR